MIIFILCILNAGAGLYVVDSRSNPNKVVPNNTFIVGRYWSSWRRSYYAYDVYCYSNSTSSNVGYYLFPNGGKYYSGYNNVQTLRQTPSGIRLHFSSSSGGYWGIFTCQIPDSNGNTVETSIGIYSSTPGICVHP